MTFILGILLIEKIVDMVYHYYSYTTGKRLLEEVKKIREILDGGGGTNSKDAENDRNARKRLQIKVVTDLNTLRSSYAGRTVPKWLDDEIAVEEEKLYRMTKHD